MKRLWGKIKQFWDGLQVGESAALVGLSEFGGYYMLPPDRRLDEPTQRAPFRPDMFRDGSGIVHISSGKPLTPQTKASLDAMVKAAALQLRHPEVDRWFDDGGYCWNKDRKVTV